MTLSIAQLREQVAKHFPNVEKVSDSVVRFTREASNLPFAVYYMDIAQELPATLGSLTKYQDQIIGRRYFEDRQSLQWSNYLYFILSKKRLATMEVRRAKELIESDRSYARKFVISEDELERVLEPPVLVPLPAAQQTNILSVWASRLVEAGLDKAIFSDDDLPRRLSRIESSTPVPPAKHAVPQPATDIKAASFISSLRLNYYREFPLMRVFEFGTVNLIYGPNATGKTSLLEAIELLYCGRNKRNPDRHNHYEITAVLADGRTEKATQGRKLQDFRHNHLEWYGQSEVKTNDLYLSFAQFNFLDTDAAVSLADSTAHIEDDLSKLLVGPDTSKTWHNMERVWEALAAQLRNLHALESQINGEIKALEKQLTEAASVKRESDAIRERLEKMLRRLDWDIPKGTTDKVAARLIATSSELAAIAGQAEHITWASSPSSINGLVKYCRETRDAVAKAEAGIERLETILTSQQRPTEAIARSREALNVLKEIQTFITAGLPDRVTERTRQQDAVATHTNWFAGFEEPFLELLSRSDLTATVRSCHRAAFSRCVTAGKQLATRKSEYDDFTKLRDQSVKLRQELREIAGAILRGSENPDECPLCHTRFKRGDLTKHIKEGIDEHVERRGQILLAQIRESEAAVRNASQVEMAFTWFAAFCKKAGLAGDINVGPALAQVENTRKQLMEARSRIDILSRDIRALEAEGYSIEKYGLLLARLSAMGHELTNVSLAAISRSVSAIERDMELSSEKLRTESSNANELKQTLERILHVKPNDVPTFKKSLSGLRERLATTQSLHSRLSGFLKFCPWPVGKPIAEFRITAESVRKMAAELQTAFGKEKLAKTTYSEFTKRKGQLTKQLEDIRRRIKRYQQAHSVLESLRKNYSLTDAMKSALERNRASIEAIFARIHAPAEFSGLGQSITSLVRKSNGAQANLGEISTGQRAAFGLSIFLAQNSQLTVAPPVVLIDDPIAHVDDLNSLSFLDYLREVAITGRRQIFFATANDKLATLFERKFDFLGSKEFRRFNLSRKIQGSGQSNNLH